MMTTEQRKEFRRMLGTAVIDVQKAHVGFGPETVVTEILAALLSLAAYIAKDNLGMPRAAFERACRIATEEEWMTKETLQ